MPHRRLGLGDGERIVLWWEEWRDMLGCDGERIVLCGRCGDMYMFGCDGERFGLCGRSGEIC